MPDQPRELRLVLTVPDHDEAVQIYRDLLGMREQAVFEDGNGGRATLLSAGLATVEVGDEAHAEAVDVLETGRWVAAGARIALEVTDASQTADRLAAAGLRRVAPAVRTPWGSVNARLEGPGGQQITVYSTDVHLARRPRLDGPVVLAEPEPAWAATASDLIREIRAALGGTAVGLEHVGSTAVPGLPAKPILDLVLGVPDPADEAAYVPALEALGYRLSIREPEWHQHRMLDRARPAVHLHVFAADSGELQRMVDFRDRLRREPADRELYLRTKRELAARNWAYTQDYADAKAGIVAEILRRAATASAGAAASPPAGQSGRASRLHGVVVDCAQPAALARWWAAVLGHRVRPYSDEDLAWLSEHGYAGPEEDPSVAIEDPAGRHPTIWFNRVPEPKTTKNRLHLDVAADPDELVVAGATVVLPEGDDRGWTVLADPEGNEFCASARWAAGR